MQSKVRGSNGFVLLDNITNISPPTNDETAAYTESQQYSINKHKKDFHTLVAAAKNMKLPDPCNMDAVSNS